MLLYTKQHYPSLFSVCYLCFVIRIPNLKFFLSQFDSILGQSCPKHLLYQLQEFLQFMFIFSDNLILRLKYLLEQMIRLSWCKCVKPSFNIPNALLAVFAHQSIAFRAQFFLEKFLPWSLLTKMEEGNLYVILTKPKPNAKYY